MSRPLITMGSLNFHHFLLRKFFAAFALTVCLPAMSFAGVKFNFLGGQGADYLYYTPGFSATWNGISDTATPFPLLTLGTMGSRIAPADYNGDNITDAGVFLAGAWDIRFINHNGSGTVIGSVADTLGQTGDLQVSGNFLGTREAEIAVFRPSTGEWLIKTLPTSPQPGQLLTVVWGIAGDIPVQEDYDGDCITDIAIFRPSSGDWWVRFSSNPQAYVVFHWGQAGDIPVPADYDGDGRADYAVFRPSVIPPPTWYLFQSHDGIKIKVFGAPSDLPVPADYNGDGKTDIAVFFNGTWTVDLPMLPVISGAAGDQPIPHAYIQ